MPYALNFPVNELGNHEKVCPIIEYALSWYMPYMRVDCSSCTSSRLQQFVSIVHRRDGRTIDVARQWTDHDTERCTN